MTAPLKLSESQLAARCQNRRPDASHEPFCFELFRRAIVENCTLCWHYLHAHYYSLVRAWVVRRNVLDPDIVDDLTQDAFISFTRFFTPEKLTRANSLGAILRYLKLCATTAVAQMRRRSDSGPSAVEWDEETLDADVQTPSAETLTLERLAAQELWAILEAVCQDQRDRLVARLMFVANQKPAYLTENYPASFIDVYDVYRVKRNLLDRLRRHPALASQPLK